MSSDLRMCNSIGERELSEEGVQIRGSTPLTSTRLILNYLQERRDQVTRLPYNKCEQIEEDARLFRVRLAALDIHAGQVVRMRVLWI
jgi:hypothetical protein